MPSPNFIPRAIACLALLTAVAPVAAQDVFVVGSQVGADAGTTAVVPLYVRDRAGTLLDASGGSGATVQKLSLAIRVTPFLGVVDGVSFLRVGATALAKPLFETHVDDGPDQAWIVAFDEAMDPLQLPLDPTSPGTLVGNLYLDLAAGLPDGLRIRLDPTAETTALGNGPGTASESAANGQLVSIRGTVLLGPAAIFADGFESGDTSAW